jgi:hypothetical protein
MAPLNSWVFPTLKFLHKSVAGKAQILRALWLLSRVEFSLLAIVTGVGAGTQWWGQLSEGTRTTWRRGGDGSGQLS